MEVLQERGRIFFLEKPFLRRLFLRWKARRPFAKTVPSVPKIFELHRETVRKVDPEFFSSISINFPKPGTERNFVSYESAFAKIQRQRSHSFTSSQTHLDPIN